MQLCSQLEDIFQAVCGFIHLHVTAVSVASAEVLRGVHTIVCACVLADVVKALVPILNVQP